MTYQELNKMSVSELRSLNRKVVEMIKTKNRTNAVMAKDSLSVGMRVQVNHPKLKGQWFEIQKINRTKAVLKEEGGWTSYNVPMNIIEVQ